jgi:hypothetical protein
MPACVLLLPTKSYVCCRRYFFLNAGILVLGTIAYVLIARNYTEKPVPPSKGALAKGAAGDDEFKAA